MADEQTEDALSGVEPIEAPPPQKPGIFESVKSRASEAVSGARAELDRRAQEEREIREATEAAKTEAKLRITAEKEARRVQEFEARKQAAVQKEVARQYEHARPVHERVGSYVEQAKLGVGRFAEFSKRAEIDGQGRTALTFSGEGGMLRDLVATTGGNREMGGDQSGSQLRSMLTQPYTRKGSAMSGMAWGGKFTFLGKADRMGGSMFGKSGMFGTKAMKRGRRKKR